MSLETVLMFKTEIDSIVEVKNLNKTASAHTCTRHKLASIIHFSLVCHGHYLYCLLLNVPCLILLKLLVFFDVLSGGRRCVIKIQWLFADRFINNLVLDVLLILHQDR
jgi:hypothetical protein